MTAPIALAGLSYTYDKSDRPVLRDVDLAIAPGEIVLLTGPSGSGTTTRSPVLDGGQGRRSRRSNSRPLLSMISRESGTPRLAFTCS